MDDEEYIRKAVELAEGWSLSESDEFWARPKGLGAYYEADQWFLDALAAQLVRQVDDKSHAEIDIYRTCTIVSWRREKTSGMCERHGDRTMNTIKAIVDSGVLDAPST